MKKVLIISNVSGGLFSFRRELIEKLIQEKHHVTIFASNTGKTEEFRKMGCEYTEVVMDRHGTNPFA